MVEVDRRNKPTPGSIWSVSESTTTTTPGGDLVSSMPVYVCPKVKEMGSFSASSE